MENEDEKELALLEEMGKNFSCDPMRYASYKHLLKNIRQKIVKLDDTIPFDGSKCVTDCGGKCCYNNEGNIMINSFDVFKIVTSELGASLGYDDTTKLFRGQQGPLMYSLGRTFGHPMAWILFKKLRNGMTACPFLNITKPARSKRELLRLKKKHGGKLPTVYTKDGTPRGLCILHKVKPTVCRSYPIGRLGKPSGSGFFYIFNTPSDQCVCVKTKKRVKVRDYVIEWNLTEYHSGADQYHAVMTQLDPSVIGLGGLVADVLFNFDAPAIRSGFPPHKFRPSYDAIMSAAKQLIVHWGKDLDQVSAALRSINWDAEKDGHLNQMLRRYWPS